MTDKQPEALRLADWLETDVWDLKTPRDAAAELRRLHKAVNALQILVAIRGERIDTQQAVMRQALEALEQLEYGIGHEEAIAALREQLEGKK